MQLASFDGAGLPSVKKTTGANNGHGCGNAQRQSRKTGGLPCRGRAARIMTTALLQPASRDAIWTGPIIDCDVHANVPSLDALFKYQDNVWIQAARERNWKGPAGLRLSYPPAAPTTARPEWRSPGVTPASELAMLQRDILDPARVERAVLNCYYAVDSMRHPDWAIALARAVNDWVIENWLDKDPRLVASLVIPARDPVAAAAEIDRVGSHPGFVQVLIPVRSDRLYGQRIFWPIYEAMTRHDLVMGIHWGGQAESGPTPTGFASWFIEEYTAEPQLFAAQMTSLIIEGVFQKFPTLRVSVLEGGFTWMPTWSWNLNKKWKGLRRDFPGSTAFRRRSFATTSASRSRRWIWGRRTRCAGSWTG